jgi:uncharacterized membrane protein
MSVFKPKTSFDKVFEIGILLKGVDGLIELIGGLLLVVANPERINRFVSQITHNELIHDPHDFFATHIVHWSQQLTKGAVLFAGIYLLAHGVAKLVLVVEILRNHLWAYVGLIVLTGIFIIYQTYDIVVAGSLSLVLLNIFDIIIIYLTIREYKKQLEIRRPKQEQSN